MMDNLSGGVPERRTFYLAKAHEAEELAAAMRDDVSRRLVLQIAQSWRLLATLVHQELQSNAS